MEALICFSLWGVRFLTRQDEWKIVYFLRYSFHIRQPKTLRNKIPIRPAKESVKAMSEKIRISKTMDAITNVIIDILITIRNVLQKRQFERWML